MASQTTVTVTQEDIDEGIRNSSSKCVVATAIARTFPKAHHIVADVHSVRFTNGPRRYTYLTPPSVMEYIVAFDAGDELHPFTFRLRDDQRLVSQRSQRTDEGRKSDAAGTKVKYARKKVETLEAAPDVTEAQLQVAREALAVAEANQSLVRAQAAAKPKAKVEDIDEVPPQGIKKPAKRSTVLRRNVRTYGARAMRINNDQGPGDFRGPLDDEPATV